MKSALNMLGALIVCISYDKLCRLVIFTCITLRVMDKNVLQLKFSKNTRR